MKWDQNSYARFFYRGREHQEAQMRAALLHAGDLEGKTVLDVGCGYGDLIGFLPVCEYVGIDTNEQAIEQARALWPDHEFRHTDRVCPADVVIAVATLQCCGNKRLALLSWISAARERLVVVTCDWKHLPEADQAQEEWDGIDAEVYVPDPDDDYVVYVVPSAYAAVVATKETP